MLVEILLHFNLSYSYTFGGEEEVQERAELGTLDACPLPFRLLLFPSPFPSLTSS